ncbi:uncharacterized protein LOC121595175 [Anopheles merus]|uniref:uncharacterized protein LOC121595175 n=1 Tax=Anopheles merus TaxID=30066 RepID=UPI001BE4035E|nr:uncharacterized protein LOC121595175 [Anopheles merus]XP_041774805.1 uncharacterized protein LOC121595175 [Anopheles merus]XP_041774806.1 uncharacterized protein LOC121595175 [Anopheles merus]
MEPSTKKQKTTHEYNRVKANNEPMPSSSKTTTPSKTNDDQDLSSKQDKQIMEPSAKKRKEASDCNTAVEKNELLPSSSKTATSSQYNDDEDSSSNQDKPNMPAQAEQQKMVNQSENIAANNSSYHGMFYHLQLGMIILLRAFSLHCVRKLSKFEITMENIEGGKFDDIVLYYENAIVFKGTVYIQAKHKDPVGELKPITKNELLNGPNTKGPFSIPIYFVSYLAHYPKRKDVDTLGVSHKYILCTNAPLSDDVTFMLPLAQPRTDGIFLLFDRIGGNFYAINQANNNVKHELRKVSLEALGKTLASYIKNGKEVSGDDYYILQLYSNLIASCVEKVNPGIYKFTEKPQTTVGTELIRIVKNLLLNTKNNKSKVQKENKEAENILIASSFEELLSNTRDEEPYAKVDLIIQKFCDEILLVCGTKNDKQLLEQAPDMMPDWVNAKKDKFENFSYMLLKALRENPVDDINLENIKKKFIELKVNDYYCEIEKFTQQYLDSKNNMYSIITLEPSSLQTLELYDFVNELSYRIYRYRNSANMKMSSVIVKQTAELLGYSCLIVDCSDGQSKGNLCTVLSDVMKFIYDVGLSSRTIITILGKLENELITTIKKYSRDSETKVIVVEQIAEDDSSEDCLLVEHLTTELREQLYEQYKQLHLFGTSIALKQIVREKDSLSFLCKVLDRYGHKKDENTNEKSFQTISSWYISRTVQPYDYLYGSYFDMVSFGNKLLFDSSIKPSRETLVRMKNIIDSNNESICSLTSKFRDQSKVRIVLDDAGCGKTTFFVRLALDLSRNDPSLCVIRMTSLNYVVDFNELKTSDFISMDDTTLIRILFRLFHLTLFTTTANSQSVKNINEIRKQSEQMEKLLTVSNGNVVLDDGKANKSPWAIEQMLQLRLFKEKLNAKQFIILFDGFDEIAPTYKEFVMAYLGKLATFSGIKELYLSSRPYNFMDDLKKTFKNSTIYRLCPFSQEDQIKFMYNYLSCNSTVWKECNEIDRYRLLYVMYRQGEHCMNDLMHIPLFLDMGCSMLLPILEESVDLSQRTVNATKLDLEHFDKFHILTNFVEQKLRILNTDKCGTTDSASLIPALQHQTLSVNKERKQKLGLLAILVIFDEEKREDMLTQQDKFNASSYIQEITQGKEKTGIVLGVQDDIPQFCHRIFAEYFAACWLFDHKDRFKKVSFFRSTSYWTENLILMRNYFDRMVLRESHGCELHTAILNRSVQEDRDILYNNPAAINQKDALGRLPLHLAAVDEEVDVIDKLLEKMSSDSINVKDELFGWSALDYAFVHHHKRFINTLLKHQATVDENTLFDQTVANNLRSLLDHAHLCGKCLEAHEHTEMTAESFYRRVVEYILSERRLDIFEDRYELDKSSVLEFTVKNEMHGLLKQMVNSNKLQSREKILHGKLKNLIDIIISNNDFDGAKLIVNEMSSLPSEVDDETLFGMIKLAILSKHTQAFNLLFPQLCSKLNIQICEDMQEAHFDAELDWETASLDGIIYPCSIRNNDWTIMTDRDGRLVEQNVIETLLTCAVSVGNMEVLKYIVRKTNTIIRNIHIRKIMLLLSKYGHVFHKKSMSAFKYLLDQSSDLNSIDDEGRNLLHWAVKNGCFFMLPCLIAKGFDPSVANSANGWNAFHYAVFNENFTTNDWKTKALNYFLKTCKMEVFDFLKRMFDPDVFGCLAVTVSPNQHRQYKNILNKRQVCLMAMFDVFDNPTRDNLLTPDELRDSEQCLQDIAQASELTGIIHKNKGNIQFCHRIFAYYFAACWLFDHKDQCKKVSFFQSTSYWKDDFLLMQYYFDRMVLRESHGCELHTAILNQSEQQVRDILSNNPAAINQKDAVGRLPLHLAAVDKGVDVIDQLLKKMSASSINVKDELFGWSALDYAFAYHHESFINTLLKHQATVDENTLFEQTVANDLRSLLDHAHLCGKCLEAHGHTKLTAESFHRRVVEYLVDEKRLDIFAPLDDLKHSSVVKSILERNMFGLFEQIVYESRAKIPEYKFIELFQEACNNRAFDIAMIIVSEFKVALPKVVANETIIEIVKCAIKRTNMKAFIELFRQLCLEQNIHTVEDMEDMHCDAEVDCDVPSMNANEYPYTCCIRNNDWTIMTDRDGRLVEQNVIETLLTCAVSVGNMEVLKYIVRKTNTVIRNEIIRNIMRLLPKYEDVLHKKSMSAFKYLLDQSSDLNSIDDEGRNLLHWTVKNGCFFMLPCLIAKGFDPSVANSANGWKAFHYAAFNENFTTDDRKTDAFNYFLKTCKMEEFDVLKRMFDPDVFGCLAVTFSPNQHRQYKNILNKRQVCLMTMFDVFDKPTRDDILTQDELRDGEQCLQDIVKASELTGIIQGVRNGIPQFCLGTFEKYFAACWLFDHKDRFKKVSFFRSTSYWTVNLIQMRNYFDRMVLLESHGCDLHMAILNRSVQHDRDILSNNPTAINQKDAVGRLPLHLAAVHNGVDVIDQLLEEMSASSINVKDELFGWSALDYAFVYHHKRFINTLLKHQATVDEDVLFEQTVANDLRSLLDHAHLCGKCLEAHEHTKMFAESIHRRVIEYLVDEKRLDIFAPLDDLKYSSVVKSILERNMFGLFEQIVLQSRAKFPEHKFIELFQEAFNNREFDIAMIIVSECKVALPKVVANETIIEIIKCAIKRINMKAFIELFRQLCLEQNIHTVEDMEDMHCDAEVDCDVPSMNANEYPSTCCIRNNERSLMTDRDGRLVEQNLIETLLTCAVSVGNMEVLKYIVRKTNTIIRNIHIRKIMLLLPKYGHVFHKKSMSAFKYLLDQSSDLNSIDDEGRNLLHWTVKNGCFFMLPCLIAKGFDPSVANSANGWNAFHYAAFNENFTTNDWKTKALNYFLKTCKMEVFDFLKRMFDPDVFGCLAVTVSPNQHRQYKNILNKRQVCLMAMFDVFDKPTRDNLLTPDELRDSEQCLQDIAQASELTGIMHKNKGNIQFCHRIFAYYFAACWLFDHKDQCKKVSFFRSTSYWKDDFFQMRDYFDRMVLRESHGCELHMAILNRSVQQVRDILSNIPAAINQKDAFGRLPLHLAAVQKKVDVINLLLEKMCVSSINVKDELFGWSALDYAFFYHHESFINTLLKHQAVVDENTLFEQTVANDLRSLLDHAHLCGKCLEAHGHTKLTAESFHRRVVEYLVDEKRLDIFATLDDLKHSSVVKSILKRNMFGLFEQIVLQSRAKIPEYKFIELFQEACNNRAFDIAMIIVSECKVALPKVVANETIIEIVKCAIKRTNMKAFIELFRHLCLEQNIHTVEDMEDMHCDAEVDCDVPSMNANEYPYTCCIRNNDWTIMTDRDGRLVEQNVIETLLTCAVSVGNMEVLKYIVRKTNTIIRNEIIRNIMLLLPKYEDVFHKKSMSAFKYLLDQSSDLNSIDDEGRNLLHWTVKNGCFFMLPCLIAKGFDPSVANSANGWNAFHYAAFNENFTTDDWKTKAFNYFLKTCKMEEFDVLKRMFDPDVFGCLAVTFSPNQHRQYKNILNKRQVCLMTMFDVFDKPTRDNLLTTDELRDGEQCLQDIAQASKLTGIIQGVRDGIPQFCCRIFAEYFAACWLFDHKDRFKKVSFFRSASYWTANFLQMRCFFDRMVLRESHGCELHMAILNRSEQQVRDILTNNPTAINQKDAFGRLPLHLAVVDKGVDVIDQLSEKMSASSINVKDELFGWSALDYTFATENITLIKKFIQCNATVDKNVLRQQIAFNNLKMMLHVTNLYGKCLLECASTEQIGKELLKEVAEKMLKERQFDIFLPLNKLNSFSIIEYCAKEHMFELFKQFVSRNQIPIEKVDKLRRIATEHKAHEIVKFLSTFETATHQN